MNEQKLKLSPPWVTYVNEIIALFGKDPDIRIVYDNEPPEVYIYVDNEEKAAALDYLLPAEVEYGNVDLLVTVIPPNDAVVLDKVPVSNKKLFDAAFKGNPVYNYSREVQGVLSNKITYVVFARNVVQFFNDNLGDIHGICTTLYQDIAADLFEGADIYGVYYNTDVDDIVGVPFGNWP